MERVISKHKKAPNYSYEILEENKKRLGVDDCKYQSVSLCFHELIHNTYEKYGKRVVILIDEADKPILDNLDNAEQAKQRRDLLRGMYSIIKGNDAYINLSF